MSNRVSGVLAGLFAALTIVVGLTGVAGAEGTGQLNNAQSLNTTTTMYADILTVGETINISTCATGNINIWNTNGTPSVTGDDTAVVTNAAFTANLACGSNVPNPITNPYRYTPASTGTYRFTIAGGSVARYDFSVTSSSSVNPDPTTPSGRIWSYAWKFSTGAYDVASATDADLYIMVPGANSGESFVWKLDLNKFSGNGYELDANSLGLNAPYSGLSATQAVSSVSPEFQIYLGYPAVAGTANTATPTITGQLFVDNANEDNIFSPGATVGIQDTGNFKFNSNVANANYAITIDTNQDGVYGTGDRLLLGKSVLGLNSVTWDGKYPNGTTVPAGVYHAKVQLRLGEYHFIAQDVETSGGTSDGGATWNNGLTIYRMTSPSTQANTQVYWDDLTQLSAQDYPTANVPAGIVSGTLTDGDSNGRADGFHTWGTFTSGGVGNNDNIDTYTYGPSDSQYVTIAVATSEAGDADGVAAAVETGAPNNGDGNGDSTVDFLQDKVASLPNSISGGYNTVQSGSCTNLSNVGIGTEASQAAQDSAYIYPVGLAAFHVNCASPGSTTTVTVFYKQQYDTTGWVARALVGSSYVTIPGATFSTVTIGGTPITKLVYSITDGGALDGDGTANGVITAIAGPGTTAPSLAVTNVENDADNIITPGQTVHYTATIANTGSVSASIASVPITIASGYGAPTNFAVTSCGSPTHGFSAPTLSVNTLTVASGATCTISYDVVAGSSLAHGSTLINSVDVPAATEGGNNPSAVAATTLTVHVTPNLSSATNVATDVNGGTLKPGDTVHYTLTLNNTGNGTATGVHVTDTISSYLEGLNSVILNGCGSTTNSSSASALDVTGVSVAVGTPCVITFNAVVKTAAPDAGSITNSATVSAATEGGVSASPAANALTIDATVVDTDNVSAVMEAASPNSGDGNNDGVADSVQSNVTALPNAVTGHYNVLQTDGCASNSNVTVAPSSTSVPDANFMYPAGIMAFSINCATPGTTATVTQYYYGSFDPSQFVARKFNPATRTYTTVPGAVLSSVTVGGQAALKIVYQVTDGSALDEDGVANGIIVDPVGPAMREASAPNTGLPASSPLLPLTALATGTLTLAAYYLLRRRSAYTI